MEGRKAKEWRRDTWKEKGRNRGRKDGRTERRREPEENQKWRKWKEIVKQLGEKLVCRMQQSNGLNRWRSTYMMCSSKGEG